MTFSSDYAFQKLPLARPFAIARGTRTAVDVVRVTLSDGKHHVTAEATPTPRYGDTCEAVERALQHYQPLLLQQLNNHGQVTTAREWLNANMAAGTARNALDCALWLLEAKQQHTSLENLVAQALDEPPLTYEQIKTVQTVGIDSPAAMALDARAQFDKGIRLLKIKLNGEQIEERMRAIRRAVPETRLVVDANEAFTAADLPLTLELLASLGVEMVEQPLPAGQDNLPAEARQIVPLCADESAHTADDLPLLLECGYRMINIKLDKCGGISEAIKLINAARHHGLDIMVGCMLGSSLAMRCALPIAARASLVDLDGPTWLAHDAAPALVFHAGQISGMDMAE
ncbi:enolase C-terminal domain-like protein [Carnimonas nigrificans]|uniref:enolase C-terminal domain-like protein n=1 Tax=Carnimonas nigrificans TaxID=64323 RepID=UPI0004700BCA|nr:enolase C-terminal domain-like protein [Carnimonas nigrificans]